MLTLDDQLAQIALGRPEITSGDDGGVDQHGRECLLLRGVVERIQPKC